MAVPKPNIRWRGAHPNNFTVGRPGASRDGRQTFHHVVGSRESAVIVFNQPSRGASSHFVVGADIIDQCVDIANTAWCDGNWESNLRTISVEHEGGQNGNGPYSDAMYEQAAHLCAWLRENYGVNRYIRHRDVSLKSTACPGGLDVERIWNRSQQIINSYNQPPAQPEWLRNRKTVTPYTVYAQKDGLYLLNLNDPNQILDARRFPLNQSFEIGSETTVGGVKYLITVSSTNTNAGGGMRASEVATKPYTPPVPQPPVPEVPSVPEWASSLLVDDANRELYVLRATPLIDLENGRPFVKDGKEVWFQAGDIIKDVSAHTIVGEVTYQMTEYSFQKTKAGDWRGSGNGIKSSDLTTDPKACPPGTPANPEVPQEPTDPVEPMPDVPNDPDTEARLTAIEQFIIKLKEFFSKINWKFWE
jgi:hypothetical protein